MRNFLFIVFFLTASKPCVSQDAIEPSKFLPPIRDAQLANLEKIGQLSISALVRFEWANPKSIDTANVLALWIPSTEEFLSTDPFPDEPERSWKKNSLAIALLFGGSDATSPPWKLFDQYPDALLTERVSIKTDSSSPNSYVISAYFTTGDGPRLFVDWHIKKENCFYPHYVVEKIGNRHIAAVLARESKFSYQIVDDTVLPKMVMSKNYDRGTGALVYQKTITVKRIAKNALRDSDDALTPEALTEEMLFGAAGVEP